MSGLSERVARPFSRWRIEPYPDEPAHGYFARLVAEEQSDNARSYAREIGLEGRNPVPMELFGAISQLPLPQEWVARLRHATPDITKEGVFLAGQRFSRRQWSLRRRYCPGCIAEAPYHRTWWNLLPIVECPFHHVRLEDHAPDGREIMFYWPYFDESPKGLKLGVRMSRGSPGRTFEAYVLGRLGISEPFQSPTYDEMDLGEAAHMCGSLGYILASDRFPKIRKGQLPPARWAEGFEASREGNVHLVESLMAWVRREIPDEERQRGWTVCWSRFVGRGRYFWPNSASILRHAMRKAVISMNNPARGHFAAGDFSSEEVGLHTLIERLGLPRTAVRRIVSQLQLVPDPAPRRWRIYLSRQQVEQIERELSDLMTVQEVANFLNVPNGCTGALHRAGVFRQADGMSFYGKPRFRRSELEDVLRRIDAIPSGPADATLSLCRVAKRTGVPIGKIAVKAYLGEIDGVVRMEGVRGFRSLRIPAESWRWKRWHSQPK